MKMFMLAAVAGAALVAAFGGRSLIGTRSHGHNVADKGFAVVELFTSEGCSSCPPADELVARIQQESKDEPVYILAYHVDYWDRLGWKDAFSDASYTRHQRQYAAWLDLESVYTPQIVVNGRKEFVGSQETTLRNAISSGLQQAGTAQLTLSNIRLDKGNLDWKYQARGAGRHTSLLVAIVQRNATTKVKAGENSGRTLLDVQIVRGLRTLQADGNGGGDGFVPLPAGVDTRDEEIIAFLQNDENGQILAATRAAIPRE